MNAMELFTLTLSLDDKASAALRQWLTGILDAYSTEHGGGGGEAQAIVTAAAEALNKAIRSSAPAGTTIIVTTSIVDRNVYVTVTDPEGGTTRAKAADTADTSDDVGDECESCIDDNLGVAIMQGLVDQVDFYEADDGSVVRLVKRLPLAAAPSLAERTTSRLAASPATL